MRIGIIGGSGLYQMEGVTSLEEVVVETPSAPVRRRAVANSTVILSHSFRVTDAATYSPGEVNYRANIWALKSLDESVLSVSAVGSMREELPRTHRLYRPVHRPYWDNAHIFDNGRVAHVRSRNRFA